MGVQQQKPQPHRIFGNIFHFQVLKTVSGISNQLKADLPKSSTTNT